MTNEEIKEILMNQQNQIDALSTLLDTVIQRLDVTCEITDLLNKMCDTLSVSIDDISSRCDIFSSITDSLDKMIDVHEKRLDRLEK
jgi:two-component sensor histidine kinase